MTETRTPISELGLSTMTHNTLQREGIRTVELLAECEPADLMDFRGFGPKALAEIRAALAARGLQLHEPGEGDGEDTFVPWRLRPLVRTRP